MKKSLGQIAYEASKDGGQQNFGPWKKAPEVVRRVHEEMAQAVAKAVIVESELGKVFKNLSDYIKKERRNYVLSQRTK